MTQHLTEPTVQRYARQIILPEIGGAGQTALMNSRILVIGAGGLGSPAALYLAAAGVGTLGIVDDDVVDLSNLQRQLLHDDSRLAQAKTASAAHSLKRANPHITVIEHATRLDADNAREIVVDYDLVLDGSDNHATRLTLHDACYRARVPLIAGAVLGFDGQLTTYKAYLGPPHPSLTCLHPQTPDAAALPSCAAAGVLSPACGVIGALMAVEALKERLDLGRSLSGILLMYSALEGALHEMRFKRCADNPLFQTLSA